MKYLLSVYLELYNEMIYLMINFYLISSCGNENNFEKSNIVVYWFI